MNDRALNVLRHAVVPIIVAAISGYFVKQNAREQTKASYENLAPQVGQLMDEVSGLKEELAKLQGRIDELSKTTRVIVLRSDAPVAPWNVGKTSNGSGGATSRSDAATAGSLGRGETKVEVMVDKPASAAPSNRSTLKKPAPKFDDMLRGL